MSLHHCLWQTNLCLYSEPPRRQSRPSGWQNLDAPTLQDEPLSRASLLSHLRSLPLANSGRPEMLPLAGRAQGFGPALQIPPSLLPTPNRLRLAPLARTIRILPSRLTLAKAGVSGRPHRLVREVLRYHIGSHKMPASLLVKRFDHLKVQNPLLSLFWQT